MPDFEALFRTSPNAYVLLDPELMIVEANEAYLQATEKDREDIVGHYMFDVFPADPSDSDETNVRRLRTSLEQVLSKGEPHSLALIHYAIPRQTPEGEIFEDRYWSTTHTPILNDEGEVAFILQHTVDVTALQEEPTQEESEKPEAATDADVPWKQVKEGLFRRAQSVQEAYWTLDSDRRHLHRLFDQAPGFMAFLRGPDHVFEMVNEAYYQVVGHREIVGKPVREALPEVVEQGFPELLDQVYSTGEAFVGQEMDVQLQREPDGPLDEVYLDFVYQPITDPEGSVVGIFAQGHDVTEKKRTRDELHQYQDHLEELIRERTRELEESEEALRQAQKMEAIGKLTGGVAHDFNNLLQIIGGNLQFLERSLGGSEKTRRRLETATGAVERGAKLASQLLAFARRQPLEPEVIHPGRLLNGMKELLRRTLDETIEIETSVEYDLWNIHADPNQLENVILNLAINARDAMNEEGKLTIEAGNAILDDDYADAHPEVTPGRYVCMAISDTGRGMPPEDIERAFEPFFSTKSDEGTGLGLSMAHGFVKQSNGHIKIYSEVGEGTTIKIYLPRSLEEEEDTEPEEPVGPVEGGDETLLVVEDDDDVRTTVVEMLADLGYHVLKASDGQSALAILQSGVDVDLLFTDVVMPGPLESTDLAHQAKEHLPSLDVLFTSGYTENAIVHQGRLDPGISLLNKPYSQEDLARKIRHLLDDDDSGQSDRTPSASEPQERSAPEPPEQEEATSPKETSLRILLVEDDEAIRMLISEAASELGHNVSVASSTEEALETFERDGHFDVLFTDVNLPDRPGDELAFELRNRQEDLQIIIASGYGNALKEEHREEIEGATFLTKPFDVDDLEKALTQIRSSP